MKKNAEYLSFLKQDLKDLDSLKKSLERTYGLCIKIDVKKQYNDEELDTFENLIKESRKFAKKEGIKKSDLKKAIQEVRRENRT